MHTLISAFAELASSQVLKLTAGVDLTHFSNGNTHYPNGGLNVIGGRIGIVRTLGVDELPGGVTPGRLFIKPHVSYDLVIYGATRKRGLIETMCRV